MARDVCPVCEHFIEADDKVEHLHDAQGAMVVHRKCIADVVRGYYAYEGLSRSVRPRSKAQIRHEMMRRLELCAKVLAVVTEYLKERG